MRVVLFVSMVVLTLTSCGTSAGAQGAPATAPAARALGVEAAPAFRTRRCINLANALNAPREGEWGYVIEEEHLRLIRDAGFDTVRLLVNWAAHTDPGPPHAIRPEIFERVDEVTRQALDLGLQVMIDSHNDELLRSDPILQGPRAIAMWDQIAAHYKDWPSDVYLELVNEPHDRLEGAKWNALAPRLLAAVRKHDPTRIVILGGDDWNSIDGLERFEIPDDPNVVATFHYYYPFSFSHQGADWFDDAPPLGATWGTAEDRVKLAQHFDQATAWAAARGKRLFLGEFGVFRTADEAERARWTEAVRVAADQRDVPWCYFDFTAGFNAYDRGSQTWRAPILDALDMPTPPRQN